MQDALLSLGLLLVVAKLAEGLATRLRQSALGAYVLTGIVLGPVLGVVDVEAETDLTIFFSVGIIFLFFLTGIDEIDISGFVETLRGRFFLAAAVALIVPLGASLAVAHYVLEISWASSIAVAGVISLSSLGVVVKVLGDLDHLKEPLGLEIFTTVMIVELVGLLIVGFTLEEVENPGDFKVWKVAALLGQITGFALVAWVLASRLFPPMLVRLRRLLGVPQLSFGLVIGGLFSWWWELRRSGCMAPWEHCCWALPCRACLTGCAGRCSRGYAAWPRVSSSPSSSLRQVSTWTPPSRPSRPSP